MTAKQKPVVACPHCGKDVEWDGANKFRPFCSERCKLIDLGQWANESYRIPAEQPPDEQNGDYSGQA
jgi:endogenous inhibitor of DNA gyrase (YacG/DUF329 family)